jgi:hypothetical protein
MLSLRDQGAPSLPKDLKFMSTQFEVSLGYAKSCFREGGREEEKKSKGEEEEGSQMYWHMPVILALVRQRCSKPVWNT